jgi:hypothetical protein
LRVRFCTQQVYFGQQASRMQASQALGLQIRKPSGSVGFIELSLRFFEANPRGFPRLLERLLLGGNFGSKSRVLWRQYRKPRLLFLKFEALGVGVQLDEDISRLHFLAHRKLDGHNTAGNESLHRMNSPVHFKAREIGYFNQLHTSTEEPCNPGPKENGGKEQTQQ